MHLHASLGAIHGLEGSVGLLVVLAESLGDLVSDVLEGGWRGGGLGCAVADGVGAGGGDRWAGEGNHFEVCACVCEEVIKLR